MSPEDLHTLLSDLAGWTIIALSLIVAATLVILTRIWRQR